MRPHTPWGHTPAALRLTELNDMRGQSVPPRKSSSSGPIAMHLAPPHLPLLCGFRLHTSLAHPPGLCSVSRPQFQHARRDGRDSRWGLNTQPLTCSHQCGRPMPLRSARGEPEAGRLQPVPCPCPGHATGWQYSQVRVFLASLTDRNLHCSACVRSHVQPARRAVDGPMLTHLPCRL